MLKSSRIYFLGEEKVLCMESLPYDTNQDFSLDYNLPIEKKFNKKFLKCSFQGRKLSQKGKRQLSNMENTIKSKIEEIPSN